MEGLDEGVLEHDVAVRPHLLAPLRAHGCSRLGEALHEAGVGLGHPLVQPEPRRHLTAREADGAFERAVQLDDVAGARRLVQPVDVLRDDRPDVAVALQLA